MVIDRREVVARHNVLLTEPNPQHVLSVGNGDFAFTADVTGMQTFRDYHDPLAAMAKGEVAVNTATMSTWGWHNMPNPEGFALEDAMTRYDTPRGPVFYPDKYDMEAAMAGALRDEHRAGAWLHANPQRVDLGRIGLVLRRHADQPGITDPRELDDVVQILDLWTGTLRSTFSYLGEEIEVVTVASPDDATVAFRITSSLFLDQRAGVQLAFPYPHDGFFQTDDWDAPQRHQSTLTVIRPGFAPHLFTLTPDAASVEVVVTFSDGRAKGVQSFAALVKRATTDWEAFWTSGAAIDLSASTDPRARELERRIVLSQYLTRVHSSGSMPLSADTEKCPVTVM